MHWAKLLIIVIGIFSVTLASAEVELSEDGGSLNPKMVYVEPTNMSTTQVDGEYEALPYLERRPVWGSTASFGYVYYEPVNYQPYFGPLGYSDYYKSPETPLLEAQFSIKRNTSFGSLGVEAAAGIYVNKSDVDEKTIASTLTLYPFRLGVNIALDAMSSDPILVPYASAGVYTIKYSESQASASKNGNTQVAPYVDVGLAIRLDFLDRRSARIAFRETRLQATYFFLEARKFVASGNSDDPDFGTDLSGAAGLRIEF